MASAKPIRVGVLERTERSELRFAGEAVDTLEHGVCDPTVRVDQDIYGSSPNVTLNVVTSIDSVTLRANRLRTQSGDKDQYIGGKNPLSDCKKAGNSKRGPREDSLLADGNDIDDGVQFTQLREVSPRV